MLFICLAVLNLCCFLKTFSSWGEQGLLSAGASLVAEHWAPCAGASVVLAQLCLSGPEACGAGGSSPDQDLLTQILCVGRKSLNHETTREGPVPHSSVSLGPCSPSR